MAKNNKLVKGMHTKLLSENLKETDHLEDLGIDGKIILQWISRK
jgi:hypothetical protein